MGNKRHNVQSIAEVLIDELDKFQENVKTIQSTSQAVENQIKRLENTKVKLNELDIEKLQNFSKHLEGISQRANKFRATTYLILIISISISLISGSFLYGYYQKGELDELREKTKYHEDFKAFAEKHKEEFEKFYYEERSNDD